MAAEVLQASKSLIAGLTGVRPLPSVTAQVALQVSLPLHRVCTEGTFEAHNGVGVCKEEQISAVDFHYFYGTGTCLYALDEVCYSLFSFL